MKINNAEFFTVNEMSKLLGVLPNTVKQRLFQHGIKPVSKEAIYESSALETIKCVKIGRPPKTVIEKPVKKNRKSK
jgi:hypothetical protein